MLVKLTTFNLSSFLFFHILCVFSVKKANFSNELAFLTFVFQPYIPPIKFKYYLLIHFITLYSAVCFDLLKSEIRRCNNIPTPKPHAAPLVANTCCVHKYSLKSLRLFPLIMYKWKSYFKYSRRKIRLFSPIRSFHH